jgi:hypothetical protein
MQLTSLGSIDVKSAWAGPGRIAVAALQAVIDNFSTIADNFATIATALTPSITTSGAADYIPVLADAERSIRRTRATAQTLTVPLNATAAFPIGTVIRTEQAGAGALTVVATGGVTINVLATKTLVLLGQFAVARLEKVGTNEWTISGDLTAA